MRIDKSPIRVYKTNPQKIRKRLGIANFLTGTGMTLTFVAAPYTCIRETSEINYSITKRDSDSDAPAYKEFLQDFGFLFGSAILCGSAGTYAGHLRTRLEKLEEK